MKNALIMASTLLAACAPSAHDASAGFDRPAESQPCRPEDAAKLVGHSAPDNVQVTEHTGASMIRRIAPGDMVTQDFRMDRITLTIDQTGTVLRADCG